MKELGYCLQLEHLHFLRINNLCVLLWYLDPDVSFCHLLPILLDDLLAVLLHTVSATPYLPSSAIHPVL